MRATISILVLLGLMAWFKFGDPQKEVRYEAKTMNSVVENVGNRTAYHYHVKNVIRLLGADIYRPDGYYTATTYPLLKSSGSAAIAALEATKEPVGIRMRLNDSAAFALCLEPQFGFWEQYGRWILLFVLLCAIFFAK